MPDETGNKISISFSSLAIVFSVIVTLIGGIQYINSRLEQSSVMDAAHQQEIEAMKNNINYLAKHCDK